MRIVEPLKRLKLLPALFYKEGTAFSVSIDITNVCNLRCSHCYYYMKEYQQNQLTDEEWLNKLKDIKRTYPKAVHCTWVGGEPLLKRNLLQSGMKFFDFNWIVTNGTIPLPRWDCVYVVSIDGTKDYHDSIRGKGMYERSKENVLRSTSKIYLHTVINSINANTIKDLVREWSETNIIGIKFSFYTPMTNAVDMLYMSDSDRNQVVDKILSLKREYGKFIVMGKREIELMRPQNSYMAVGANCLIMKGATISFDSNGNIKRPCVMGRMDCNRCGCTVPYFTHAIFREKDLETILAMSRTL